jgi:hypothetical protein
VTDRVPHEVLPAHVARLAITVWYFDRDEYTRARASGSEASEQTDHSEQEAIEAYYARLDPPRHAARAAERRVPTRACMRAPLVWQAEIRRFEERFGEGTVRHGEKGDGPTALAAG